MYSQYRCIKAPQCMALPEGTTPAEGAACFVNPLIALGMVETMRRESYQHRRLIFEGCERASNWTLGPGAADSTGAWDLCPIYTAT
jgi:hypothetical protein